MSGAAAQVSAGWRPSSAATRAALASSALVAAAVGLARPDLLVLAAPFVVHTVAAVVRRPAAEPVLSSRLAHSDVREGEGTTATVRLAGCGDAEHALFALEREAFQHAEPAHGVVGTSAAFGDEVEISVPVASTRWGRRNAGGGLVAATGPWAGRQWGPHPVAPGRLTTLPLPGVFDSRAPSPHPVGLVGTHQARRSGQGSELSDIRPFHSGDRLRRIHWRQSVRTGALHVTGTVAEEDSSVLLLLDNGTDVGSSRGIDGSASTLDVAVRAAGALAEHYLQRGDRVGLRVLGSTERSAVAIRGGRRQLRRVLDTLARVTPGERRSGTGSARLPFRVPAGAVVLVLSPVLTEEAAGAAVGLARGGLTVVVVDTLPAHPDFDDVGAEAERRRSVAWRIRLLERALVLARLERAGVAVVPWRGPGTLDAVLRGLARRSRGPRAVTR